MSTGVTLFLNLAGSRTRMWIPNFGELAVSLQCRSKMNASFSYFLAYYASWLWCCWWAAELKMDGNSNVNSNISSNKWSEGRLKIRDLGFGGSGL